MKNTCSYIVNFFVLLFFVAINLSYLLYIYNNKSLTFIVIFILLLLLTIVKYKTNNVSTDKNTLIHVLNGIVIGYKIALIVFVMTLGKEIFNNDINFNTYFICYIPSILYIFDSDNINEIVKFCKYNILK